MTGIFLRATAVTRGWNGYRNKSQHRKSTLEKKILPPFQQGFEPAAFQSRVRCSNHWAIPAPLARQRLRYRLNSSQSSRVSQDSAKIDMHPKSSELQSLRDKCLPGSDTLPSGPGLTGRSQLPSAKTVGWSVTWLKTSSKARSATVSSSV